MTSTERESDGRWPELAVVGTGVLLAFAPWFSASAVSLLLAEEWQTTGLDLPMLTGGAGRACRSGTWHRRDRGQADVVSSRVLFVAVP